MCVCDVKTQVEDFWRLYNNIRQPRGLERNSNYHFFKVLTPSSSSLLSFSHHLLFYFLFNPLQEMLLKKELNCILSLPLLFCCPYYTATFPLTPPPHPSPRQQEGIEPLWEDPANEQGGKWVLTLRDEAILDKVWEELVSTHSRVKTCLQNLVVQFNSQKCPRRRFPTQPARIENKCALIGVLTIKYSAPNATTQGF